MEKVLKLIREQRLLRPGDRAAVACSGGADSVALLRVLLDLRGELGVVISVAHFHHGIRGAEADGDQQFVQELAAQHGLEFHSGSGDVPAFAAMNKLSLETAARDLRHEWFAKLIHQTKVDVIATAHTLDDQAETVLMRLLRGTGVRGLAGIAPIQRERHLIRPLLSTSRPEVEAYLNSLNQPWREDSTNQDQAHTRNRVRHTLLPLLAREFNPSVRETLADTAELARAEEEYWSGQLSQLMPRLIREGKPSRSGRSTSGESQKVLAVEIVTLRNLPLALRRRILRAVAERFDAPLEFKHIQQLTSLIEGDEQAKKLAFPAQLEVNRTLREIQFSQKVDYSQENYAYSLTIPGEIEVPELRCTIRATLINAGKQKVSSYNAASLLDPSLLGNELTVRNWRAGDRYFPAHSQSPKKVKELLQPDRLGPLFSLAERKIWPVIESKGQIVWMRGFPVPAAFAGSSENAILIEERKMSGEVPE